MRLIAACLVVERPSKFSHALISPEAENTRVVEKHVEARTGFR